jgi:RNA polymerase sigma-70 factor (ECF subfamily)
LHIEVRMSQSIAIETGSAREAAHFERSVKPLLPGLRGAALRLTRNAYDADDLLQETTLRAWRFWSHYTHGSNLRAWLHRILLNTFVNGYRQKRREREVMRVLQQLESEREPQPAEPSALRASLSEELQGSLAELPAEFRAVLWAVAVDDLSYREAADTLGCPVGTVMSRLYRARRLLQNALRPAISAPAALAQCATSAYPGAAFRAA